MLAQQYEKEIPRLVHERSLLSGTTAVCVSGLLTRAARPATTQRLVFRGFELAPNSPLDTGPGYFPAAVPISVEQAGVDVFIDAGHAAGQKLPSFLWGVPDAVNEPIEFFVDGICGGWC
jgi:hypothetical protein